MSRQDDGDRAPGRDRRPDGLERLWTPYRMAYIRGENKPADDSAGECPFCRIPQLDDDDAGSSYAAASGVRRAQPLPLRARAT